MKIIEAALFRLAQEEKISVEQAKIMKAVYHKKSASFATLLIETGLENNTLALELMRLRKEGVIQEKQGLYFAENFQEKILELMSKVELREIPIMTR